MKWKKGCIVYGPDLVSDDERFEIVKAHRRTSKWELFDRLLKQRHPGDTMRACKEKAEIIVNIHELSKGS